jgi:uncharacterized glyoxalase superfamily protein PhnB
MKITNLLFWVQENKLSERFYKKLGFDIIRSEEDISTVQLNGFEIWLVNMRDEARFTGDALAAEKGKGMYVYIRVDNIDSSYDKLVKDGIKPATEPKAWPWGNREFIVKDPDGYKLCFWQKISHEA